MKNKDLLEYTKELMKLFEDSNLSSFEYGEEDFSLKLQKGGEQVVATPVVAKSIVEEVVEKVDENCKEVVVSPIVGTFYQSSAPGANPYVNVGDSVKAGQVLCIVEAMKVMNEITAPCSGVISEILVDDAEGVEYNQPLFKIK
ncbi:MAG: acetyl-CoA carboxylase biotin carboxyl carrier protein [Bacilli bacterium]